MTDFEGEEVTLSVTSIPELFEEKIEFIDGQLVFDPNELTEEQYKTSQFEVLVLLTDTSNLSTPYTIIVMLEPTTVYGLSAFQENTFIIMDLMDEVASGSLDDNSTLDNSTSANSTSDNSTSSNSTSDNSTSSNSTSDNSTSNENSDSESD